MAADKPTLSFRPEQASDEEFCFELYASTRQEELDALGWPSTERAAFLKLQFKAHEGYRHVFPHADFQLVLLNDRPVGRLIVNRAGSEIRLVDLALMPETQNSGLGTRILQGISAEAEATLKPLRLSVLKGARSVRLAQRLGFVHIAESDLYEELEWRPPRPQSGTGCHP